MLLKITHEKINKNTIILLTNNPRTSVPVVINNFPVMLVGENKTYKYQNHPLSAW